ncbi:uncharacterized protein LOC111715685 isoform X3 [Eurytemora carolleeae]|uniref:uncharacterized protein LOC111715685 isoform X1 n=1 Tax=Eurytemora carolleeae TaxID=1294199 RepID=UPI000C77072B|nr:uncharacterized protein LOC111715685 isoform X1 [Eurytemora carolleeae]XP_023346812.1 uncharacterized protein LOC111715685 isoform X2 [Eurytemora carolleeae]XP_023346814.1 uncharacterized protein LOC111715685 isoform X3 [Eurytemora carolleeae]|eukprot:XP_023346811.1 uncharacterized protein LOC111715685 isoform X1 [Eurytemora affinis]
MILLSFDETLSLELFNFRYSSGDQREGFFSDNILDGQVIYTRNDGVTFIEKWTNGTRLVDEDQLVQVGLNLADIITPKSSDNISDNDETAVNNDQTAVNDDQTPVNDDQTAVNDDQTTDNNDQTALNDDQTAVNDDQTTEIKENIPNLKLSREEQNGINLELIQKAIRSGDKRALFAAKDELKNKENSVEYANIKSDSR